MNKITYKCRNCGEERDEEIVNFDFATAFSFILIFFVMAFAGMYSSLAFVDEIQTESNWSSIGLISIFGMFFLGFIVGKYSKK